MGFDANLRKLYDFIYRAKLKNNLIEHELDHVYGGVVKDDIQIISNPLEVDDFRWISLDYLETDMHINPHNYTKWFLHIIDFMKEHKGLIKKLFE